MLPCDLEWSDGMHSEYQCPFELPSFVGILDALHRGGGPIYKRWECVWLFGSHAGACAVVRKHRGRLAIGLGPGHGPMLKYRRGSRVPVGLRLLHLGPYLIKLSPQG